MFFMRETEWKNIFYKMFRFSEKNKQNRLIEKTDVFNKNVIKLIFRKKKFWWGKNYF